MSGRLQKQAGTAKRRKKGRKIEYEYDGLNRLVKIDYPETTDTVYVYGDENAGLAAGKILSLTDASGVLSYEYGRLGEVTKETRTLTSHVGHSVSAVASVMEYRSDYLGRMQWIIYPDGERVEYGYDNGGQVVSVTGEHYGQEFEYVTNILYDQYGQRTRIEYGNGTSTDYEYDPARRWLSSIRTENSRGRTFQNISYSFDRVGNVLGYENDCLDSVTGKYRTSQSYSYDNLYQLIRVDGSTTYNPYMSPVAEYESTYSQTFTFDDKGLGNLMGKVSKEKTNPNRHIGDELNYTFENIYDEKYAHRLVNSGDRYFKYDENGNIIVEQDGEFGEETVTYHEVTEEAEDVYGTDYGWGLFKEKSGESMTSARSFRRTYTWNERNQLIASSDNAVSVAYTYGQDGQRSNKYTSSSETLYFNKMWTLHVDSGNAYYGGQNAKNIYLGDTRIVTKLAGAKETTAHEETYKQYFYHSDHLGSASLISDYKGDEYQRIEYTPYGETWVEKTNNTGSEFLPYKFTAKEQDEETGLYYYGARYLDPKYSRWLSTDPALGDYIPQAPISDEARKNNQNLPGMGGVFNHINGNLYAYAANNPVHYIDPDGNAMTGILLLMHGVAKYNQLKEEHYARNEVQKEYESNYPKKQDALSIKFEQLGLNKGIDEAERMDSYHEQGTGNPSPLGNDKLVKPDENGNGKGSFELVYDSNDNLVTDPVNMGTYNKCDPDKSKIGHFFQDMVPYYLWGNTPDDPTTMMERITGTYKYNVNATKAEANEQRLHDALSEAHIW